LGAITPSIDGRDLVTAIIRRETVVARRISLRDMAFRKSVVGKENVIRCEYIKLRSTNFRDCAYIPRVVVKLR